MPRAASSARWIVPFVLVQACSSGDQRGTRALYELERLAFVPPAYCSLGEQADYSLTRAIVFDRFELTRGDLLYYWPDRERAADQLPWSPDLAGTEPEKLDWPAFVDYFEAEELAVARGMRLPTPREWIHVAVGRRGYVVPWGGREGPLWANTSNLEGLRSPWRVGTFESGRSRPYGCYDLLGNVWEWVSGIVPGYDSRLEAPEYDGWDTLTSVMGGAYDTPYRLTFVLPRFHARKVDKRTLSPSIGARMCADADVYLWNAAPRWGTDEAARARVTAVAKSWSADSIAREGLRSLLANLRSRAGAPAALAWLEEGAASRE